jgi:hypothetical protein
VGGSEKIQRKKKSIMARQKMGKICMKKFIFRKIFISLALEFFFAG